MQAVPSVRFERERLENGLEVILYRDNRVPLVHVTIHYRVGSSFEQPGQSGFAHLFEHLMFQGSRHVPKTEHGKLVDSAGGKWNASTSKDRTNYHETLPSHFLDLGLWLEADRMQFLDVSPENFENQRQTVIEEKKQSYDNRPYGLGFLRFDELAYSNWAYGHPIIGSELDLRAAGYGDVLSFHERFYGPSNAVLVVSGDIDEKDTLKRVRRYFGGAQNGVRPSAPALDEPSQPSEKFERMEDRLAVLPMIGVGFHMAPFGTDESHALTMASLILAKGESSRLFGRLVRERSLVTSFSVSPNGYRGPQLFSAWMQVQRAVDPHEVLEIVREELVRMAEEAVEQRELEKARNQIISGFVAARSTVTGIGEGLARYALLFDDPGRFDRELESYLSVTPEAITEAAQRVFRADNRTILLIEPCGVAQMENE